MKQTFLCLILSLVAVVAISQTLNDKANPFPKTISVTGSSEMDIIPDEIYVVIDLREYDRKGQGKTDLETIKSSFLQSCHDAGLPDSAVTIASYEGYNNPWLKKKRKAELYASIAYQIKFNKSRDIDNLVDRLDDDATQNFRIVKTSHSRITEFRRQLKIQAVKAAKDKGTYLTDAIGERLGEAITITEPEETQVGMYNVPKGGMANETVRFKEDKSFMVDQTASLDFKRITLRYEVNVVFVLK